MLLDYLLALFLPQFINEQPAPDQAGEILHHRTGEKQHLPPLRYENHLEQNH